MEAKEKAIKVVDAIFINDEFSKWLGIDRVSESPGECRLKMTVRPEMCNGFKIAHGGISYSLADSALAFACNSHGVKSVSIETSISHVAAIKVGDTLYAETEEMSCSNKLAVYHIRVVNQNDECVALFKGTVYRTGKDWELK